MGKPVIHISETDAASDFPALLKHVRAGAEVIIESKSEPIAVLCALDSFRRAISERIAAPRRMTIHLVTLEIARLAGRIDGQQ